MRDTFFYVDCETIPSQSPAVLEEIGGRCIVPELNLDSITAAANLVDPVKITGDIEKRRTKEVVPVVQARLPLRRRPPSLLRRVHRAAAKSVMGGVGMKSPQQQLDLFAWFAATRAPVVAPPSAGPSEIRERRAAFRRRIADAGLVMNPHYDGDGNIWNPLGLDHPSPMLKFPLHARGERVYLAHPALAGEPFVDEVERRLGERPVYDDCVADVRHRYEYYHARDLCRRDRYQLLLQTIHLTTKLAVAETVGADLRGACEPSDAITPAIAREILTWLGVPETGWATDDILLEAVDIEWRVPMDTSDRDRELLPQENAWDCVHAYERGLVQRDRDGRAVPVKVKEAA